MGKVARAFRVTDPNAVAILDMQGVGKLKSGKSGDVYLVREPIDPFFEQHTLPYISPGPELKSGKGKFLPPITYEYQGDGEGRGLTVNPYRFNQAPEMALRRGYAPAVPLDGYTNPLASDLVRLRSPVTVYHDGTYVDTKPEFWPDLLPYEPHYWLDRGYAPAIDLDRRPNEFSQAILSDIAQRRYVSRSYDDPFADVLF